MLYVLFVTGLVLIAAVVISAVDDIRRCMINGSGPPTT